MATITHLPATHYKGIYHKATDRLYIARKEGKRYTYYVAPSNGDHGDPFGTDWRLIALTEGEPIEPTDLPKGIEQYLTEVLI